MKLLNGNILIRVDEEAKKSQAGILLVEGSMRLPQTGVVIGASKGVTDVKLNDKVIFLRYAAIDGVEKGTRLCKIEHIVAIIDDEKTA